MISCSWDNCYHVWDTDSHAYVGTWKNLHFDCPLSTLCRWDRVFHCWMVYSHFRDGTVVVWLKKGNVNPSILVTKNLTNSPRDPTKQTPKSKKKRRRVSTSPNMHKHVL